MGGSGDVCEGADAEIGDPEAGGAAEPLEQLVPARSDDCLARQRWLIVFSALCSLTDSFSGA